MYVWPRMAIISDFVTQKVGAIFESLLPGMRSVWERNNLLLCFVCREEHLDRPFEDCNHARTGLSRKLPEFSCCLRVDYPINVSPNRLRDLAGLECSRIQESPMNVCASCSRVALKFRSS